MRRAIEYKSPVEGDLVVEHEDGSVGRTPLRGDELRRATSEIAEEQALERDERELADLRETVARQQRRAELLRRHPIAPLYTEPLFHLTNTAPEAQAWQQRVRRAIQHPELMEE